MAILIPKRDELFGVGLAFGQEFLEPARVLPLSECELYWYNLNDLRIAICHMDRQGPEHAAMATGEILDVYDPPLLFLLGTALGRPAKTSVADVIVSESVHDLSETRNEGGRVLFRPKEKEPPGRLRREIGNYILRFDRQELLDVIDSIPPLSFPSHHRPSSDFHLNQPQVQLEHIAGGSALHMDPTTQASIWDVDDRIRSYDMESGGFALRAKQHDGLVWGVVRGISDHGVHTEDKQELRIVASATAGAFLRSFLSNGLRECHPRTLRVPESAAQELSESQFYARFDSLQFFREQVLGRLSIDLRQLDLGRDLTLLDFAGLCVAFGASRSEAVNCMTAIREDYFTNKYGGYSYEDDLRGFIPGWPGDVHEILRTLGVDIEGATVLDVGVGNGLEVEPLFGRALASGHVVGVDVSAQMLEEARRRVPKLNTIHAAAESLNGIETRSIDLYVSLRTWVSRLFDERLARREAFRVLRPGGHLILSVPNGYVDGEGEGRGVVRGMLVGGSDKLVDRQEPLRVASRLAWLLESYGFEQVGLRSDRTDMYLWARRPSV